MKNQGKSKHGGARPGSGRKTNAQVLGLAKVLEDAVSPEEEKSIWAVIKDFALKGSLPHAQLYINYKYGKPTETVKQDTTGEMVIKIVRD